MNVLAAALVRRLAKTAAIRDPFSLSSYRPRINREFIMDLSGDEIACAAGAVAQKPSSSVLTGAFVAGSDDGSRRGLSH
jgi:hypothetical protein